MTKLEKVRLELDMINYHTKLIRQHIENAEKIIKDEDEPFRLMTFEEALERVRLENATQM